MWLRLPVTYPLPWALSASSAILFVTFISWIPDHEASYLGASSQVPGARPSSWLARSCQHAHSPVLGRAQGRAGCTGGGQVLHSNGALCSTARAVCGTLPVL